MHINRSINQNNNFHFRYAIGFAERSGPHAHIGWLSSLANATHQPYNLNNTGGPSIKVKYLEDTLKTFQILSPKVARDTFLVQHLADTTA